MPRCTTPTFTVELPLRVDDKNERFLTNAFDLGWSLYNAALRTALDNLKRMRESSSWKEACAMPEGPERTRLFKVPSAPGCSGTSIASMG